MKIHLRLALAATLAAACGGCSKQTVSYDSIAKHPSPEMAATTDRWVDVDRDYAYMRNINHRSFLDDWRRVWLIDNPVRLSPYPIVDAAGNPR